MANEISHPQYSSDLAFCDFALFPKIKRKPKEHYFDTADETQKELQMVFGQLYGKVLLRCGRDVEITVYVPKGTILKGIVTKFN